MFTSLVEVTCSCIECECATVILIDKSDDPNQYCDDCFDSSCTELHY